MYRSGVIIETFDGDKIKVNIEGVGRKSGCYLQHFVCGRCKNQSVASERPFFCNNFICEVDKSDKHMYCLNYKE